MASAPQDYDRVELVWPGKRTEIERVRLPFQVIERVNDVRRSREGQAPILTGAADLPDGWPEGWRNKLIWGDNKYVLASLLDEFAGKIDLIYIDPPFDSRTDYSMRVQVGSDTEDMEWQYVSSMLEMKSYRDTWARPGSYEQMLYERLILAYDLLSRTGSIYVHMDWRMGHYVKLLLDECLGAVGSSTRLSGCTLAAGSRKDISRGSTTPFSSTLSPMCGLSTPMKSECRTTATTRPQYSPGWDSGPWENIQPDPRGKIPEDWWSFNRPYGDEITGYSTQKPKALLDRIVRVSSNPGDICLDFFGGSGTTAVVAEELGRRWISADLGRFAIQTTRKRLLDIPECRPFEVLNLGRYERRYWQGAQAGEAIHEYYAFILKLYDSQPIAGFAHLHGERGWTPRARRCNRCAGDLRRAGTDSR